MVLQDLKSARSHLAASALNPILLLQCHRATACGPNTSSNSSQTRSRPRRMLILHDERRRQLIRPTHRPARNRTNPQGDCPFPIQASQGRTTTPVFTPQKRPSCDLEDTRLTNVSPLFQKICQLNPYNALDLQDLHTFMISYICMRRFATPNVA